MATSTPVIVSSEPTNERGSSRRALLEAASSLMIERASIDVSLSEIARRSGLNSALVKYYFGGKQGLLLALLEDVLGRGISQMEGLLTMPLSPVEKLKLHVKGIITVYFRYPYVNRLIHYLFQDPEAGVKVTETISKPLALTQAELVRQGVAAGLFKPLDPLALYFIVLGACDHLFFGTHILRGAFGIDTIDDDLRRTYTDTLLDLLLNGMLTDGARKSNEG